MKAVSSQAQHIKKLAPVATDAGAASRPFKGMRPWRGLHSGQHGQKAGGDRDGVGPAGAALGRWEGKRAGFKVHAVQRDSGFFKAASGVEGDFKADAHPLRNVRHSQGPTHAADFLVCKDRLAEDRCLAGSEIHHGHGGQVTQQTALPVDPFEDFNVLQGLVAPGEGSVGAGGRCAPGDVVQGRGRCKVLKQDPTLIHKAGQVPPAVAVIDFGVGGDLVVVQHAVYPLRARASAVPFVDRKGGGFVQGLGPVQRVVDTVAGGLGDPAAVWRLKAYIIPLGVFSFVNRRHGTITANHLKTGNN